MWTVIGLAAATPLIIDTVGIPRTAAGVSIALAVAAGLTRVTASTPYRSSSRRGSDRPRPTPGHQRQHRNGTRAVGRADERRRRMTEPDQTDVALELAQLRGTVEAGFPASTAASPCSPNATSRPASNVDDARRSCRSTSHLWASASTTCATPA
ncbi:hypothetical protein [Streptomyces sp. AS02]|uniref:hypothetical protein n=1 Tax=Streptomyces sp. AS02 TaxID=2938946 RepID=UPI0020203C83|nr:hypothetical protein [Streptomyces sp. AS02]MCL8011396.1 hypothetical protein [Streptomyces sp. AS02]